MAYESRAVKRFKVLYNSANTTNKLTYQLVINAAKVSLSGNKLEQKTYRHYTGYPGGLKEVGARRLLRENPEKVLREAILEMLPKNKLGKALARKLRICAGDKHRHQAQKPEVYPLPKAKG